MSGGLWSAAHVSIKEVELSSAAIFHERKPDCLRVLAQAFQSTTHQLWRRNLSKYHRSPCWVHFETTARDVRMIPRKWYVNVEIFCRYGWNLSSVSRFVRKISLAQFGFFCFPPGFGTQEGGGTGVLVALLEMLPSSSTYIYYII